MATRSKKTTRKANATPAAKVTVPKGYVRIAGFGESWPKEDTAPGSAIEGVITEFDEFTSKQGRKSRTVQTAKIETKDGKLYTVYESAMLRGLFEYEEGTAVFIAFNGYGEAKRGQNAPKLFDVYVK